MKFNIEEVINRATETAMELIKATKLNDLMDVESANASVPVDEEHHIFMDFGHSQDLKEVWLWFSLERNDRDGWEDSLDEQDTMDLSEESIKLNLRYLLEDWQ